MKNLLILASSMALVCAQAAQAEVYLGGKIGHSWFDYDCTLSSPCDDSESGGGVLAGYQFNDMIALEAGYDYLGSLKSNYAGMIMDENANAITIAPKLSLALDDAVSLFAKVGLASFDYGSVDDSVLLLGLGVEYAFNNHWSTRLEFQRLNDIDDGPVDDMDIDSAFLTLVYRFGTSAAPVMISSEPAPAPVMKTEPVAEPEPEAAPAVEVFKEFGTELFETNSAQLAAGSEKYLGWLVGVMKKYPQANVKIVGHTDSRGSAAYNQKLSEKRAGAVAEYLIAQGIEASRVSASGLGETQPKASNETAEGRKANRRVEVTIDEFEYQVE